MNAFLIGLSWRDPEEVASFVRMGLDDDSRWSTGIFITAGDKATALSWGNEVGKKFMDFLFANKNYQPKELELFCWVEEDPPKSSWKHCLDFFQRIQIGQHPEFQKMTADAYGDWCKKAGRS
jgi:hypothetical protein